MSLSPRNSGQTHKSRLHEKSERWSRKKTRATRTPSLFCAKEKGGQGKGNIQPFRRIPATWFNGREPGPRSQVQSLLFPNAQPFSAFSALSACSALKPSGFAATLIRSHQRKSKYSSPSSALHRSGFRPPVSGFSVPPLPPLRAQFTRRGGRSLR